MQIHDMADLSSIVFFFILDNGIFSLDLVVPNFDDPVSGGEEEIERSQNEIHVIDSLVLYDIHSKRNGLIFPRLETTTPEVVDSLNV